MKRYTCIILIAVMVIAPMCGYANINEKNIIVCADPADYDEMTGKWNTDGLQTIFAPGNGDYPTLGSFVSEAGTETYYVDLGNKAGFHKTMMDGNSFYAGLWVKLRGFATGANFNIYSVEGDVTYHRAFLWYDKEASEIKLEYYNGGELCTTAELSAEYANKWVYLGFAREVGTEQTTCTIYVNGVAKASEKNSLMNIGEATLNIAKAKNPAYYGSEALGEVEVLSQIPTEDEILKKYTDNVLKYRAAEQNCKIFSLDITGEEAVDTVGGATIEKVNGACIAPHYYPYGATDSALVLPETGYVKAESEKLICGNDMTWELWISADTSKFGKIFAMGDSNNPEAYAVLQEGKVIFRAGRYDDETYISATVCEIEADKLNHLVFLRSYFEVDGEGYFKYSAYCNSEQIQGFPAIRCGAAPTGKKTPVFIGGGITADILAFNVYNEIISPDNIRKAYFETVRPLNVSPAYGEKGVSINKGYIEMEYDLPLTTEMTELQNITVKKNGSTVDADKMLQNNKLICVISDEMEFKTQYSVYLNDKILTEFETAEATAYRRYTYDFDVSIPEITYLDDKADPMVDIVDNPSNGTKALKVTGDGNDWCKFQIDLPAEIQTKYVLVKMDMINETSEVAKYVHLNDSNGNTSVRLGYDSQYYGTLYYSRDDCQMPYVKKENVTTSTFEMLLNTVEHKVYTTHSSGEEMTGAFINEAAAGVKTLKFEINNPNTQIYYDDIEIMGFDDLAAIETASYTVTGITSGDEAVKTLAEAAGKTISVAVEKTGKFTLICALYEGTTLVEIAEYSDGKITLDIPSDATTKTYTTKLFAWRSLTDITPLLTAETLFEN